jgi:hypothetical protein
MLICLAPIGNTSTNYLKINAKASQPAFSIVTLLSVELYAGHTFLDPLQDTKVSTIHANKTSEKNFFLLPMAYFR